MGLRDRMKRLSASVEEIDAERLRGRYSETQGCTAISDCGGRQRVKVVGEIQAIRVVPRAGSPSVEVTIDDGTGEVVAVFTGRSRIGGLGHGKGVIVEGMGRPEGDHLEILNPSYTLL
jgi:hypothetical protein